ncbi:MAG: protoporphyrinogen oxidase [Acidimicrobiia bacterium]|nr:protoporphyrinogen oxidase [Acidimicrobiia bacterium]
MATSQEHSGPAHVVVVGGGVAGLVAARRLALHGARVTLLEASSRLGGQVHTVEVADHWIDVGAESLHGIAPVLALVDEIGLSERLVTARPGSASIWSGGHLRRLPAGVGPAGPTRLVPMLGSRVLSARGLARAALEPLIPRGPERDDVGVGAYISRRFGHEVTDRLVDPVLGGLHAGDVTRLSMRATVPQLAHLATGHRSILLAHRARGAGSPPSFLSFTTGLSTLVDQLLDGTDVVARRGHPVQAIRPVADGYHVDGPSGPPLHADAVVVALPASAAARVLTPMARQTADELDQVTTATVATVVAVYDRRDTDGVAALRSTGLLVPSSSGRLLKAATFLSAKWAHLDHPHHFFVRLSAGRARSEMITELDDAELARRLGDDLADATGLRSRPVEVEVARWPHALPQLEVGHVARLDAIRGQLSGHPGVVLAGAAYDGLGLAACIRSGEAAADQVSTALAPVGVR